MTGWEPHSPTPGDPLSPPSGDPGEPPPVPPAPQWGPPPADPFAGVAMPGSAPPVGDAPAPRDGRGAGWHSGHASGTWRAYTTGSPYGAGKGSYRARGGPPDVAANPFSGGPAAAWQRGWGRQWTPRGYRPRAGSNGMAVAGLVLAIIGVPFFFVFIPSLLGVVFGGVGLAPGRGARRGIALAAVIIGAISILGGIALYAYLGASGQLNNNNGSS